MTSSVFSALEVLHSLLIQKGRFDYSDEKICQNQIESFLISNRISFFREYSIADVGITDFYFPKSKIVLEVKAGKAWSKRGVFRQCERYCSHPEVHGLILATGKIQGLPPIIFGKPVLIYQLGLGFL